MLVHGDNITQKENNVAPNSKEEQLLKEIRQKYNEWKLANINLKGPVADTSDRDRDIAIIEARTRLFNDYKDFIDKQIYAETFDSRSNLHSSVLEEFVYYLFRDLVASISTNALIGKSHAYKDIFYSSSSFTEMVAKPSFHIEKKDHDFVIGVDITANFKCRGVGDVQAETLQIPAVAIECKTYLDKTMLEGASNAAAQLYVVNPNALYIVLSEWLKLTNDINLRKYKVDQIYILRKQKNTDRKYRFLPTYVKNPIYTDVVIHLFETVRHHLTTEWNDSNAAGLARGYLL
ncbi:Bpu10I family restriction endonuclease [Muribaculum intestinale]|uniref:Bpu10I family restriction endonuclease n=1 Tax=Muribaculum intestinale TaxID=1796646 RepID=UPI00263B9250|nr:Bpu10I family restriction endonuclease [Muribaculum intestinale]